MGTVSDLTAKRDALRDQHLAKTQGARDALSDQLEELHSQLRKGRGDKGAVEKQIAELRGKRDALRDGAAGLGELEQQLSAARRMERGALHAQLVSVLEKACAELSLEELEHREQAGREQLRELGTRVEALSAILNERRANAVADKSVAQMSAGERAAMRAAFDRADQEETQRAAG